ncbi:hypothetical protein GCM10012289_77640 [Nonomuraea cavernae]|uniref:Uncharacterized protein n=1 Tax=Nonomuraea cavernae TaxID=2045107 RepID=A0A917ZHZ7_9ACTN|nr:hypothetical protein GCM10012289_77640 [Nonomuraea cavernae]
MRADGGLGERQVLGGRGEAACVVQRDECPQQPRVHVAQPIEIFDGGIQKHSLDSMGKVVQIDHGSPTDREDEQFAVLAHERSEPGAPLWAEAASWRSTSR